MPFFVVAPPKDEAKFAEVGKELYAAAGRLGIQLNTQGFLLAWVNGTRIVVERDAEGAIVGMGLVAVGQRWSHNDFTATLVTFEGTPALLEFIKQVCTALGATHLFYESAQLTETTYEVTKFPLQ